MQTKTVGKHAVTVTVRYGKIRFAWDKQQKIEESEIASASRKVKICKSNMGIVKLRIER